MENKKQLGPLGVLVIAIFVPAAVFWPESPPKPPTPTVLTPTEAWHEVARFSGGYGNRTSGVFAIRSSDWRISWTEVKPSGPIHIWVSREGAGDLASFSESWLDSEARFDPQVTPKYVREYSVKSGKYILVHAAPGRFSVSLGSQAESWEVVVEDSY